MENSDLDLELLIRVFWGEEQLMEVWKEIEKDLRPGLKKIIIEWSNKEPTPALTIRIFEKVRQRFLDDKARKSELKEIFSKEDMQKLKAIKGRFLLVSIEEKRGLVNKFKRLKNRYLLACENEWMTGIVQHKPDIIYRAIKMGGKKSDKACELILSKNKRKVMLATKCTVEEYQDISQEAILALIQSVRHGKLVDPNRIHHYYVGAFVNMFRTHLKRKKVDSKAKEKLKNEIEEAKNLSTSATIFRFIIEEVLKGRDSVLVSTLLKAGNNCQSILMGLAEGLSAKELGKRLNMTPDSINSRATQCRSKMRGMMLSMLGDSCNRILTLYQLHRRWHRTKEEEYRLLDNIKDELGFESREQVKAEITICMSKLHEQVFST